MNAFIRTINIFNCIDKLTHSNDTLLKITDTLEQGRHEKRLLDSGHRIEIKNGVVP